MTRATTAASPQYWGSISRPTLCGKRARSSSSPLPTGSRERQYRGQSVGTGGSASPESVADTVTGAEITVQFPWNAAFRLCTVDINGVTYGHILIRTFYVPDADGFVQEFIRL